MGQSSSSKLLCMLLQIKYTFSNQSHFNHLFQPVLQLKDGELFYGRRRPRKVVLDEQVKAEILQQLHVDDTKGEFTIFCIDVSYSNSYLQAFIMELKKCIVFCSKNIFGDTLIKVYLSMSKTVEHVNQMLHQL